MMHDYPPMDDEVSPQRIDPGQSGSAELFDEPQKATVTFDKPKKRMGGVRKTLVGLCALAGAFGGYVAGVALPEPTDFVPYFMEQAVEYSAVEQDLKPLVIDGTAKPIERLYYEYHGLKEKAVDRAETLKKGGFEAYATTSLVGIGEYFSIAKQHFDNAHVKDIKGTQAPGFAFGGLGALLLGGVSYRVLRKKN